MLRAEAEHELARDAAVVGEHGGYQLTAAAIAEVYRPVEIVIGHQRRHRPKRLDAVRRLRRRRLLAIEQDGIEERALLRIAARQHDLVWIADDDLRREIRLCVLGNLREVRAQIRAFDRPDRQRERSGRIGDRDADSLAAYIERQNRYDAAFGFLPK